MKVLFLNVWHAQLADVLAAFIKEQAPIIDVFCFHEADTRQPDLLTRLLPHFQQYTTPSKVIDEHDWFNLKTYVRHGLHVRQAHTLMPSELDRGIALVTNIEVEGSELAIINTHGIAYHPDDKLDTPGRLAQTDVIIDYCRILDCPVIIGGDFNLLPEAESIKRFAQAGFRNLVTDYQVPTTRNHYIWDRYPETKQYYSDYIFTNKDIGVRAFNVPHQDVSDHLPMIVEFDIALKLAAASWNTAVATD